MKHNYKPLVEFIARFDSPDRELIYEVLRRAPECGFTDSPDEKRIAKMIAEKKSATQNKV
jgi:hypothetical protein